MVSPIGQYGVVTSNRMFWEASTGRLVKAPDCRASGGDVSRAFRCWRNDNIARQEARSRLGADKSTMEGNRDTLLLLALDAENWRKRTRAAGWEKLLEYRAREYDVDKRNRLLHEMLKIGVMCRLDSRWPGLDPAGSQAAG